MCTFTQNAGQQVASASVPQHMTPLAALAASERASARPRQRLLWVFHYAAQLQADIAHRASTWRQWSLAFDGVCLAAMIFTPMAPARLALTGGRGTTPMAPLWALYMRWLGQLSFDGRYVPGDAEPTALLYLPESMLGFEPGLRRPALINDML
jgi:hypothetical protein